MSLWRQQNNTGELDLEYCIYRSTIKRVTSLLFPQDQVDTSYLDRVFNAPDWDELSEADKRDYTYNSTFNPKPKKIIYLIRKN